jgi:hypothetical protein
MKDELRNKNELGQKWGPEQTLSQQFDLVHGSLKARVSEALKDSAKEDEFVGFLAHQFISDVYLIEWFSYA